MGNTKGKWHSTRTSEGILIHPAEADREDIALVYDQSDDSEEANAQLIVAAVNACIDLNPDNPLAVAEGIKKLYEALLFAKEHLRLGYQLHRTHPGMIVECKEPKCKELVETNEVIAKAIAEVEK